MKPHRELKELETRRKRLLAHIDELDIAQAKTIRDKNETLSEMRAVKERIEAMKSAGGEVIVSEHAVLRYIERVLSIDTDEIRRKILPADLAKLVASAGDGKYPVSDAGFRIVVKQNVVVSVLTKDE